MCKALTAQAEIRQILNEVLVARFEDSRLRVDLRGGSVGVSGEALNSSFSIRPRLFFSSREKVEALLFETGSLALIIESCA